MLRDFTTHSHKRSSFDRLIVKSIHNLNIVLAFISATLLISAFFLSNHIQKTNRELNISKTLQRKQVIARSGALAIQNTFKSLSHSLVTLSSNEQILVEDNNKSLDNYLKIWNDVYVTGVVLSDSSGTITANSSSIGSNLVGESIADSVYFRVSKSNAVGEVFISSPFVTTLDNGEKQSIVTLSTPVFSEEGEYKGVLAIAISLSDLNKALVYPLATTTESQIYLVSSSGLVWHSPYLEDIYLNVSDIFSKYSSSNSLQSEILRSLDSGKEGTLVLHDVTFVGLQKEDHATLVGYSPILFEPYGENLYLFVTIPEEDTFSLTELYSGSGLLILAVLVLILISLSLLVILFVRVAQRDSYIEGFIYGRDHMIHKTK